MTISIHTLCISLHFIDRAHLWSELPAKPFFVWYPDLDSDLASGPRFYLPDDVGNLPLLPDEVWDASLDT